MDKLTLKQFYESAIENSKMNEIEVTASYFADYAENAYSQAFVLTDEQLEDLVNISESAYYNANDYYHLTKHLEDVVIWWANLHDLFAYINITQASYRAGVFEKASKIFE